MEFCRVSIEAHRYSATIYVAGFLATLAAERTEAIVSTLTPDTGIIRLDLRAVDLIDPDAFVRVARAVNRWRDARRGRVTIEFPERSLRAERRHLRLIDQPITIGMAVSTAMT